MDPTSEPEADLARRRPDRVPLYIAVGVLLLGAAFAAYLTSIVPPAPPEVGERAKVLPVPLEIPEFALVDHLGRPFDRSRLESSWSLLFFGYTYCPDVCPMTLQRLAEVQESLGELPAPLQLVFVSVDPDRDTPERLAEYVTYFHPALLGVTGDADEIERLCRAVGAMHRKAIVRGGSGYLVDHSTKLFLVNPEAGLHAVLDDPHEAEEYAALLGRVMAAERSAR